MLKSYWDKLSPNTRRWVFICSLMGVVATAISALSPEPKVFSRGEKQQFEHLLTDEDTSKVTLQNLAAKIDNIRSDQSKIQRQIDMMNTDLRRADRDNAPERLIQKELANLQGKLKELDRRTGFTDRRIDGIEDTGLQVSQQAIEDALQGLSQEGRSGTAQLGQGINPFPVMPMMPVVPQQSQQPISQQPNQVSDEETRGNKAPLPEKVEIELEVHKNAHDFFKSSQVPDAAKMAGRAGSTGPLGSSRDKSGGGSNKRLTGRTISATDYKSSTIVAKEQEVAKQREMAASEGQESDGSVYIPSGSILEAVIISGMDAPTAKESRQDPFPTLMRLKKEALLPNRFTADVRECFLIASGYGDLSSSRAYLRGESISCVREDGGVIEARFDSFASGEDGKTGVRGRLVSKEGQIIARALQAGFMEGVSEAFDVSVVPTVNTSSTNTVQFQDVLSQDALQGGLMGGAKSAAGRIADYWIEMAEGVKPVIEIDAGRTISFILTSGVKLQLKGTTRK